MHSNQTENTSIDHAHVYSIMLVLNRKRVSFNNLYRRRSHSCQVIALGLDVVTDKTAAFNSLCLTEARLAFLVIHAC